MILLSVTILASAANLLLPADSIFYVSTYTITFWVVFVLRHVGVGSGYYLGLLRYFEFRHGAFFALGGYAMGMYLMRQIGDRGVYGNPLLPDFMVFLDWKELPWFWLAWISFGSPC